MATKNLGDRVADPLLRAYDLLSPRWIAPLFFLFAVSLLPWTIYLGISLPTRSLDQHYRLSWVGFDLFLIFTLTRTAWLAHKQVRQIELPAVATMVLLVIDAWFDVTTAAPGWPFVEAVLMAIFVELPTAALAFYISRRVERLTRSPAVNPVPGDNGD